MSYKTGLLCVVITVVVLAGAPRAGFGCHLPENLRAGEEHNMTPAQMSLLAHGGADLTQIPYVLEAATACTGGQADIYPCHNVDLLAVVQLPQIGGGSGNDLWGWTDPITNVEYALVGRSNGTAFLDLSDPENPLYVANLPTQSSNSAWRDIKVFADHAFIVADFAGNHGMQVFDLNQLRDVTSPPQTFSADAVYNGFDRAHNLAINEDTGFAYAVGSDTCSGGLHMIDVNDPLNPVSAGCFSGDGYTHDVQCVVYSGPDVAHQGSEICFASNEDTLTIVDVSVKANPVQLSRTGYSGSGYTHQGWLTEDQAFFIHDDELDELNFGHSTRTYVWDVSDLESAAITGSFTAAGSAIDHNQYVHGGHTYQANYRRGLRILSIDDPATGSLSEAAFFDTFPEADDNAFEGAWSTYPFLASGVVLVSDINRGLFVLQPQLDGGGGGLDLTATGSCPGIVTFSASGATPSANVTILRSSTAGSSTLPAGPCAGTTVDLGNPRRLMTLSADGAGDASGDRNIPSAGCGLLLQAIDDSTCELSNVTAIP